ncbi:MAG: hypothetical protein ABJA37_07135 [Ferruginibacter sp.]
MRKFIQGWWVDNFFEYLNNNDLKMEDKLSEKIYFDESCESLIKQTSKQYDALALISTFYYFIMLLHQVLLYFKFRDKILANIRDTITVRILPFFILLQVLLALIQLYYYYNGINFQRKAVAESNQILFSRSFQYYKNGNVCSIFTLSMSLIYTSFYLYFDF